MPEVPHPAILDRDAAIAVVTEHFSEQCELLRDLANYGSNLIVRAFDSSSKGMTEVIVLGVHLKQLVSMTDAAEVLFSAGCGHAAFLPARTAFEASICADWILIDDSERRAQRYLVANYRDERLWAKRTIPGTSEAVAMNAVSALLGFDIQKARPELAAEAPRHLAEVNRILSKEPLKSIDKEFDKLRGTRKRDPEWYELDGVTSLRQLSQKVGRLPEYTFFYSKGSQITHTGSYKDQIRFVDGQVRFLPLRHVADAKMLINFLGASVLHMYMAVLKRYRPAELPAFGERYLRDWRGPFQGIPNVRYSF